MVIPKFLKKDNGNWGLWSSWSSCSRSCGHGTQTRSRLCNNPPPANDGADCLGSGLEKQNCNSFECNFLFYVQSNFSFFFHLSGPIDGNWSEWSSWMCECPKYSFKILRTICYIYRTRTCDNPTPAYNGKYCSGSGFEISSKMKSNSTIYAIDQCNAQIANMTSSIL